MYVFKGLKFVINLLLYVFLYLCFKLRHVDFYYLEPIATTILMLNLKENLKYILKLVLNKNICAVLSMMSQVPVPDPTQILVPVGQ